MLETPFRFESELSADDYQKIGLLSLRWSHTEHIIGNCLKVMLRLTDEEAVIAVFSLNLEQRLNRMKELARINALNDEASVALAELTEVMKGIQFVRNNVIHAIVLDDLDEGHVFHLRSKRRSLTKAEIFSAEELTNYAAHAAISLRYALGLKDVPGARRPLPDRPDIPKFLRELIPTRKK